MRTDTTDKTPKPTVAVDLDGVLAQYDGWKGVTHIGPPIDGAREFLQELRKTYRVLIHTTRLSYAVNQAEAWTLDELIQCVVDWMHQHGMPYDSMHVRQGKPLAVAYIDDRAIRCSPETHADGIAFNETLAYLAYLEQAGLMGPWGPEQDAAQNP